MLVELYARAEQRREQAQAAVQPGRRMLAGKQRELAIRASTMRDKQGVRDGQAGDDRRRETAAADSMRAGGRG